MTQVEIIKLLVDGTLLAAVGYLAIMFGRTQVSGGHAARELRSVEESVRRLIRDADEASRELNDQLLRREQGLKRTLGDIDSAEKRGREVLATIESKDSELRSKIEVVRELMRAQPATAAASIQAATAPSATIIPNQTQTSKAAPKFEPAEANTSGVQITKHWTEIDDDDDFGLKVEKDIQPKGRAGLAASIEREQVISKPQSDASAAKTGATLQDIIKAAHRMIQDGEELQTVAARTRLPLEQVHLLARALKSHAAAAPKRSQGVNPGVGQAAVDTRLGVLGAIKREVHQV